MITITEISSYFAIEDIHTNLVIIPLETEYTLPYGLIYANEPTAATQKFIKASRKFLKTWKSRESKVFLPE